MAPAKKHEMASWSVAYAKSSAMSLSAIMLPSLRVPKRNRVRRDDVGDALGCSSLLSKLKNLSRHKVIRGDGAVRRLDDGGQNRFFRKPVEGLVPVDGLPRDADQLTEFVIGDAVRFQIIGELHVVERVTDLVTGQAFCHQFGCLAASPLW